MCCLLSLSPHVLGLLLLIISKYGSSPFPLCGGAFLQTPGSALKAFMLALLFWGAVASGFTADFPLGGAACLRPTLGAVAAAF